MINPRTIAQEIAYADVATQAANLQEKQTELDAESSGFGLAQLGVERFPERRRCAEQRYRRPGDLRRHQQ